MPADNNFAERERRPLAMARKVSFGSHSEAGVKTREVWMTILRTLKIRIQQEDVKTAFVDALNRIAQNPKTDPYNALFMGDDLYYP